MEAPALDVQLRTFPLFAALDPATVSKIAAASRRVRLAEGDPVIREGEPVRGFFAVCAGSVRLYRTSPDGREQVLQRVRPGQTFAEAALLTMQRYPASACAAAPDTELIEIGGRTFLDLFEGDPRMAKCMVASLASWLIRLVGRVEELTVLSAGARLARFLLALPSTPGEGGLAVELPIAKKDLAAQLGVTPETLSRLLRRWQDRGVVRTDGARIVVLDSGLLLALADDQPVDAD